MCLNLFSRHRFEKKIVVENRQMDYRALCKQILDYSVAVQL